MKIGSMTARHAAAWEKTRARGMAYFIVMKGILGWGLPTGLLVLLIHHSFFHSDFRTGEAIVEVIAFGLSGSLFGYLMWTYGENAYRNYLSRQEIEALENLSARS